MIKFINAQYYSTEKTTNEKFEEMPIQLDVFASTKLEPAVSKYIEEGTLRKRQMLRIIAPTENYTDYNCRVTTKHNEQNRTSVLVRANDSNERDDNLILFALPYNGYVKPLTQTNQFRVLKGFVCNYKAFKDLESDGDGRDYQLLC
jgi:hypothetical protein